MTATTTAKHKYFEAVGRRKTAIARVRLFPGAKAGYEVNGRTLENYFPVREMQATAIEAITNGKAAGTEVIHVASGAGDQRFLRFTGTVHFKKERVLGQAVVVFLFMDADKAIGLYQYFCAAVSTAKGFKLIQERPRAEFSNAEPICATDGGTKRRLHVHDFKLVVKCQSAHARSPVQA